MLRPVIRGRERAEQAVPEREEVSVVGVGLLGEPGVMDLVQVGPGRHEREHPVEPARRAEVGVLEQRVERRGGAVDRECGRARADRDRHRRERGIAQHPLHGVLPDRRGDVQRGVGVVHGMEAPQRGELVPGDVSARRTRDRTPPPRGSPPGGEGRRASAAGRSRSPRARSPAPERRRSRAGWWRT